MKKTPWQSYLLGLHSGLVYVFLYLPIAVLVVFSFNRDKINVLWTGFTWDWYQKILAPVQGSDLVESQALFDAVKNSFFVASISTVIATFLGTLVAFGMTRYRFKGKLVWDAALQIPIVIPDIVMAIALLSFFVAIKPFFLQLFGMPFELGLTTIIIAHVSFNMSFVAVVVRARLQGFDHELENAARDLGANRLQTFWHITLPLIFPGVIAGALLAFTLSWDDFMIAFFTTGTDATTLPIKVYSMIKFGLSPKINAISTITLIFTVGLILLSLKFSSVHDKKM